VSTSIEVPNGEPIVIDTNPGVAAGNPFVFQLDPGGGDKSAVFQTTGTLTSLSADLQVSLDGGTTWTTTNAAAIVAATPVKVITPVIGGALYRFNYTAGGTTIVTRVVAN
jgi:hypothetical protein